APEAAAGRRRRRGSRSHEMSGPRVRPARRAVGVLAGIWRRAAGPGAVVSPAAAVGSARAFIGQAWRTIALVGALPLAPTPPVRAAQATASRGAEAIVSEVAAVGLTVADMDRSVDFFTRVLDFRKVSDTEVAGEAFERLEDVFGARARVVRLQLGDEQLELTQ